MKAEYELFAHKFITTGDKYEAYKAIFPKASGEALQAGARRLINNQEVRRYIQTRLAELEEKLAGQARADMQRRIEEETTSMALIRKALCDIISGKKKTQKCFKFKNHLEIVEVDLSPFAVMRAVEIEMKIANGWYLKPQKKGMAPMPVTNNPVVNKKALPRQYDIDHDDLCEIWYGPDYFPALRAAMVRDNPGKAEEYRQKGERVLPYVPTAEQMQEMKEAHEKRMEEWIEAKKFADAYIDDDVEMISLESREDEHEQFPDPRSIITTYPPQETEKTGPAKETPAPVIKKIIVAKTEQNVTTERSDLNEANKKTSTFELDCNNTDMSAYPEYANDAAANPYLRTGIPKHLEGKVNPLSRPRPTQRRQYTEEEMDAISERDFQAAIREEGSCFYLPPEEREGATYKKYMQNLRLPPEGQGGD